MKEANALKTKLMKELNQLLRSKGQFNDDMETGDMFDDDLEEGDFDLTGKIANMDFDDYSDDDIDLTVLEEDDFEGSSRFQRPDLEDLMGTKVTHEGTEPKEKSNIGLDVPRDENRRTQRTSNEYFYNAQHTEGRSGKD